uniref:Small ribosomal subunit protein uS15m n=1 Tax=Scapholeberis mucronata TaxID=202097 RepID=A0A4Y7NLN7_9CRUS|nr:EOG090X09BQ [Scapholeberis mucronata]SVE93733.1 EOG090X09BQ [Scapholeberis mucronata]
MIRTFRPSVQIEWVPPPKVSCLDPSKSGDRGGLPRVDLNRLQYQFTRHNPEVLFTDREDVPEEIKKLATLKYAPTKRQVQVIKHDTLATVQRHVHDCSSLESKIACLTIKLRNLQRHAVDCKKDTRSRIVCKETIEKRNSLLKTLRRTDYKRFEWLLEKLDLVYHPHPNPIVPVTRKGALRKLADVYCEKIRNERLEAYKQELEKEKIKFKEEKEKTLQWIEQEEKELGLRK